MKEFLKVRGNPLVGPQPTIDMNEEQAKLREARNTGVRNVTYNFKYSHHLGDVIEELTAFIKPLRVSILF